MFPSKVPMKRDAPTPELMVYSFKYLSESPDKGHSHENGENIRSPSTEPKI
jgi:hypothetical protein